MDPVTIALTLAAQFAPDLIDLLRGHPKAQDVATKVVQLAQAASGQTTPDAALKVIQADPNIALQFQKAVLDNKVALAQITAQAKKDDADADNRADEILTDRIAKLEGTASDLLAVPYLGQFMLWVRGSQRIVIGYGTAYLDYLWLIGALGKLEEMPQRLLFTASLLVFVVLFGERAVKNVAPLVVDMIQARYGGK